MFGRKFLAAAMTCLAFSAMAEEVVSGKDKHGRTIIGDTAYEAPPPTNTSDGPRTKVIYGTDDRIDVYQETNPLRQVLAASTCGLMDASDVTNNGNGTYTLSLSAYTQNGKPACAGEPFANQPTVAFCTGFLVGPDLIATAGHCYSSSDIASTRFVFGFKMQNSTTAVSTVNANQVYQGVQLVGQMLSGGIDYAVIRVDRTVTAPGAVILPVRQTGGVVTNDSIGVIGHPSGLPMKIAFGANTRVYGNTNTDYFTANLDTYGGNSGSPVFHQTSGMVEGILVRGATDFVVGSTCFTSNQLPDSSADEDVSRASQFNSFLLKPFDRAVYGLGATGTIRIADAAGGATISAVVTTTIGDSETIVLNQATASKLYQGNFTTGVPPGAATPGNGIVEVSAAGTINLSYTPIASATTPVGQPITASATIDPTAPIITSVLVSSVSSDRITLQVSATKPVTLQVIGGFTCDQGTTLGISSTLSASQAISLENLQSCSNYLFKVRAEDAAGNVAWADNSGQCYSASTTGMTTNFTENFDGSVTGWTSSATQGVNNWAVRSDAGAHTGSQVYSYTPGATNVADASLVSPALPAADTLSFRHTYAFETPAYDAGVLEYRTSAVGPWIDMGSRILSGGYTGTITATSGNPLGGRSGWIASSSSNMGLVQVNFSGLPAGTQVRFRFGSDSSAASGGWYIDTVRLTSPVACPVASTDNDWMLMQ